MISRIPMMAVEWYPREAAKLIADQLNAGEQSLPLEDRWDFRVLESTIESNPRRDMLKSLWNDRCAIACHDERGEFVSFWTGES